MEAPPSGGDRRFSQRNKSVIPVRSNNINNASPNPNASPKPSPAQKDGSYFQELLKKKYEKKTDSNPLGLVTGP